MLLHRGPSPVDFGVPTRYSVNEWTFSIILPTINMEISLSTRLGTPIPNEQGADIDPRRRPFFRQVLQPYGSLEFRSPETGQYNCHGLVFASRRTCILESSLVELILREDGYRRINEGDAIVGDLELIRK